MQGMTDRSIGIAGVGLALIFGALQFAPVSVPIWLIYCGVGTGILMLGIALGLGLGSRRKPSESVTPKIASDALLKLHVYNDHRLPDRLEVKNIYRWYFMSHILVGRTQDGKEHETVLPTLFITFDPDIRVTTLRVRSPDMTLPRHEVKDFNNKSAIIVFSGPIPAGTLEVCVEP